MCQIVCILIISSSKETTTALFKNLIKCLFSLQSNPQGFNILTFGSMCSCVPTKMNASKTDNLQKL